LVEEKQEREKVIREK